MAKKIILILAAIVCFGVSTFSQTTKCTTVNLNLRESQNSSSKIIVVIPIDTELFI